MQGTLRQSAVLLRAAVFACVRFGPWSGLLAEIKMKHLMQLLI